MMKLNMIAAYLRARMTNEKGATAVEYGLLVSLIALAMIAGVTAFGGHLKDFFQGLVTKF
jgi:pilus assembly protein Flp/PilA